MPATLTDPRQAFTERYLMGRGSFEPRDFGVPMERAEFVDLMAEEFNEHVRGLISVDELVLRPRGAMHFCDCVRQKHGWIDLPDDIILRSVMNRRKNP